MVHSDENLTAHMESFLEEVENLVRHMEEELKKEYKDRFTAITLEI